MLLLTSLMCLWDVVCFMWSPTKAPHRWATWHDGGSKYVVRLISCIPNFNFRFTKAIADPGDCINSYRYLCIQCGKPRQSSHHDVMKLVNMNMGILTASTPPRESPVMSTLNSIGATGRKPNVSDQKGRYLHDSNLRQELKRKYAATGPRAGEYVFDMFENNNIYSQMSENTMAERTEARCRSRERGGEPYYGLCEYSLKLGSRIHPCACCLTPYINPAQYFWHTPKFGVHIRSQSPQSTNEKE